MRRVLSKCGRVLSAIMAAAMVFTSLPVSGIAGYAAEESVHTDIGVSGSAEDHTQIETVDDNQFAEIDVDSENDDSVLSGGVRQLL